MRDVVGNVVGESGFKPLFEQYQRQIEAIVKSDLMKCLDAKEMRRLVFVFRFISEIKNTVRNSMCTFCFTQLCPQCTRKNCQFVRWILC